MKRRKQYLYHVSPRRLDAIQVDRRFPCYSDLEPNTPRLCVCPAVPNCFAAAMLVGLTGRAAHVYRTEKKVKGITPRDVWDAAITGERWLIPPMRLPYFATVDAADVKRVYEAVWWFHKATRQRASCSLRIAQLQIAWGVLGERFPSRREQWLCSKAGELWKIDDGEDYILEQIEAHEK